MFKTTSKFLFALAAFGFVAAVAWAMATGNHELGMEGLLGPLTFGYKGYVGQHVGYAILMALSVTSFVLGVVVAALGEADPEAEAQVLGVETVPEVEPPATANYWPIVAAFSAGAVVLGVAVGSALFVVGMIGLVASLVEWAVRAWSDRATGDPAVNKSIRDRFMHPVEFPVLAVLGVAFVVLATSRILLALDKTGTYLVFALVPLLIFVVGTLLVLRPNLNRSVVAGLLLVGGIALLAGGVVAAIAGQHHEDHPKEEGHEESGLAPLPDARAFVIEVGTR